MRKPVRRDAGVPRKPRYIKQNLERRRLWRCLCSRYSCRGRRTFRKHPSTYASGPRMCPCGAPYRVDWARTLGIEARKYTCECAAAHYPHRKGWCAKATLAALANA